MKTKHILFSVVGLAVIIIFIYSFNSTSSSGIAYPDKIQQYRIEKNEFMKSSSESPLTKDQKSGFTGLNYFPVNEKLKIKADFEPSETSDYRILPMSKGEQQEYKVHGHAVFQLNNSIYRLVVFKSADENEDALFLPFFDTSNEVTTYGGGRYLEPELVNKNTILLDFNYAYNPYCAYSPDYICPLPPLENRLSANINAGEKMYEKGN